MELYQPHYPRPANAKKVAEIYNSRVNDIISQFPSGFVQAHGISAAEDPFGPAVTNEDHPLEHAIMLSVQNPEDPKCKELQTFEGVKIVYVPPFGEYRDFGRSIDMEVTGQLVEMGNSTSKTEKAQTEQSVFAYPAAPSIDYNIYRPLVDYCMIGNIQATQIVDNRYKLRGSDGTLGHVFTKSDASYLVTAGHVLAGFPTSDTFQPPCKRVPDSELIYPTNASEFKVADKTHQIIREDCDLGFCKVASTVQFQLTEEIDGFPVESRVVDWAALNAKVRVVKIGPFTKKTYGVLANPNLHFKDASNVEHTFTAIVGNDPTPFGIPGDSGSMVYALLESKWLPLGILKGGFANNVMVLTPWPLVLAEFLKLSMS